MKRIIPVFFLLCCFAVVSAQRSISSEAEPIASIKNSWAKAPVHIPNNVSIDAPLMGNGDITMSVGSSGDGVRYYLSKNDFWRLRSQADNLSGPRVVGFLDIHIGGFDKADFSAEQLIRDGVTTCHLEKEGHSVVVKSWVSATENLIFLEINAIDYTTPISVSLTAPANKQAVLKTGRLNDIHWLTRAFADSVDIPTEVAVAMKTLHHQNDTIRVEPGKKLLIVLAVGSGFNAKVHRVKAVESRLDAAEPRVKKVAALANVLDRIQRINEDSIERLKQQHDHWWGAYWGKSSVTLDDSVLMKAYYQGLYTMAACSRDPKFPPGIFGWNTTDLPAWNGDYHLNYNFQAPFYGLYAANRLEQGAPHDGPLIDFMPRGEWYAKNVTHTRGVLYPVGIGPLGIEVTRNFPLDGYTKQESVEQGGLMYGQRSNAALGLTNMAQYWRCTYDKTYAANIYPYALAVVNFWEDYLKLENGRYVIYGDAIHEGSGKDKNPILSLGLVRNAFDLILDLSAALQADEGRRAKWKDILSRLSDFPVQIRNGRKVFRYTEEGVDWWDGNGLGIQHIYPGNAITFDSREELLVVARNTIDEMQRWQDMNTSNSFFAAAIRVGYDSSVILSELHKYALHTYPNGFQLNNPHGIENSCTVANALDEMLCMSAGNVIRLFPVFPKEKNASFKNIRAWGAFLVSSRLVDGVVSDVEIVSEKGRICNVVNPWPGRKILLVRNGKEAETMVGDRIAFKTGINETIELKAL
jgi:alpha-L-fucosidase 2